MGNDASCCLRTGSRPFLDMTIKGFGEYRRKMLKMVAIEEDKI